MVNGEPAPKINRYLTDPRNRVPAQPGSKRSLGRFYTASYFDPYVEGVLESSAQKIRQAISLRKGNLHIAIPVDIIEWAQERFYVPSTGKPILFQPHQIATLKLAFTRDANNNFPYRLFIYSTIKQSGKSTIAGMVMRWYAETQQRHSDLYALGNDKEQAKSRSFREVRRSIELDPAYDVGRSRLPGEWDLSAAETMRCIRTGSEIRALPIDPKGEAGGKPAIQTWTELWGVEHDIGRLFWEELTPVPTIPDSMRIVETYAGFTNESQLLYEQYEIGLAGHQLTAGELAARTGTPLGAFAEAQNPDDLVPLWENDTASTLMYWDTGLAARRMPWQRGERGDAYYREQESALPGPAFDRLHNNHWTSSEAAFIQQEWWDACKDVDLPELVPGDKTPLVIGVDAATTGDCFAIVVVSRHPVRSEEVAVRRVKILDPKTSGGRVNYEEAMDFLRLICGGGCIHRHPKSAPHAGQRWLANDRGPECEQCLNQEWDIPSHNVVQICYDPYQLEGHMQELRRDGVAWCEQFLQTQARLKSDRALYDAILARKIAHTGDVGLRQHILNAGARVQKDEDSTLKLIKVTPRKKIDAAVALSMASDRCKYLRI